MESLQLNYFKVPFLAKENQNSSNLHIVGIIDSSGSMSSWWKWIAEFWNTVIPKQNLYTITFDTRPRVCDTNILSKSITEHGGGMTAIPDAFSVFEKHLNELPKETNITTIFISDGQDNNLNTLDERMSKLQGNKQHKINFICLGIQSGFPTFLSMKLRTLYHRGDENIPALYLIEYVSEKAFFNKFEGIKKYFYSSGAIRVDPAVNIYPWDESVLESVYEGSWVILKSDEVTLNGDIRLKYNNDLSIEDVVEIFRGWIQQLQMVSLSDIKLAQTFACTCLKEMNNIIDRMNSKFKVDIRNQDQTPTINPLETFFDRAKRNYVFRYGGRINWFVQEVEQLSEGKSPKFENEFEAAKRMNLGTITGKYEQKALALKNVTVGEFQNVVNEFIAVFKKYKKFKPSNCDLKKILSEPNFIDGFKFIKSQFDLLQSFPFSGIACKLKRNEGSESNPWLIDIKGLLNKDCDLVTLFQKQFKIELQDKQNIQSQVLIAERIEEMVDYNALIPLFSSDDEDIEEILNTRLINYLISFSVTQHPDGLFNFAYLSLINQFLSLIQKVGVSWSKKQEYEELCLSSINIFYSQSKEYKKFMNELIENPIEFIQKNNQLKAENFFIFLWIITKNQMAEKDTLFQIREQILMIAIKKLVKQYGIANLIKPEFKDEDNEKITKYFEDQIPKYYSLSDFRKDFAPKYQEFLQMADKSVTIARKFFSEDKVFEQLESYTLNELGVHTDPLEYSFIAKHINDYEFNYFEKKIDRNIDLLKQTVINKIDIESIKKVPGYTDMYNKMDQLFNKKFKEVHFEIKPLKYEQLLIFAKENEIDAKLLKFNPQTGLTSNACMSPHCQFYLRPHDEFRKHLGGWQGTIPSGFHRFLQKRINQNIDEIYKAAQQKWKIKAGKGKKAKVFPEDYGTTKEFTINYILMILNQYKLMSIIENKGEQNQEEQKVDDIQIKK